jgi:hypothetical protein
MGLPSRDEGLLAALAGITGVAGSYALAGYTPSYVVAPIDRVVVDNTPGKIVTWTIENIGEEGHYLHIALSTVIAVAIFAVIALGGVYVARRTDTPIAGIGLAGLSSWAVPTVITGEPLFAVGSAIPVTLLTAASTTLEVADPDYARRRVLAASAGAVGFAGLSLGSGRLFAGSSLDLDDTAPGVGDGSEIEQRFAEAESRELDIAGDVPGLVSSIGEFYLTDIAEFDPEIPSEDWSLSITGEVGNDVEIDYGELTDMPVEHRNITLRCVGEQLNGQKLDSAVWTGTPIRALLEEVDPQGECGCVMIHAEDGYFVQFPVEALEDGFLAWGMNGQPLPKQHGHPARVLVPGHWGETNVKWIDKIELLEEEEDGYWEQRGWQGTGPVNTVAKLWDDTALDNGNIEVAGHAYAGLREIDRVEVSIDGGESWTDAELSEPLPDDDVWQQWRHEFEPDGEHEVVVRAVDGEGNVQTEEESSPSPSGATGWVRQTMSR